MGPGGTEVLLSNERHSVVRASTRATVLSCYPKTFKDFGGVDQVSREGPDSCTGFTLPTLTTVYTDGSFKQIGGVRDHTRWGLQRHPYRLHSVTSLCLLL